MSKTITRKQFLARSSRWIAGATAFLTLPLNATEGPAESTPSRPVTRIKMTTIGATDLTPVEDWYTNWLGYSVAERGEISEVITLAPASSFSLSPSRP